VVFEPPGRPPIVLLGELDAAVHEFTNLEEHGTSATTAPPGQLWALDRLNEAVPRLSRLATPVPAGVDLHLHGLALFEDVLFAVNHGFRRGGERIERWRVSVSLHGSEGPPVELRHLGAITGHDGDGEGVGGWSFTSKMNAGINAVAPLGVSEVFLTQFVDGPASMEGAGTAIAEQPDASPVTRARRHPPPRTRSLEPHLPAQHTGARLLSWCVPA
jgi:hypothetical protein